MAKQSDDAVRLLGPLGAEVMQVLWAAREELPVRAVMETLNQGRPEPLAYTTVMTVLSRLAERGAATRNRVGRGYAYSPAVADVAQLAVDDLLRDHGEAAIAHFVSRARADDQLRARLERLVAGDPDTETRRGG